MFKEVEEAYERIKEIVNPTPVMTSSTLNGITGSECFFKCENFQRTGAFKFRGAFNALSQLSPEQKRKGVITHSSGNHAQALALAARLLGIKAVAVMPENAPLMKVAATKGYGAEIFFVVLSQPIERKLLGLSSKGTVILLYIPLMTPRLSLALGPLPMN